SSCGPVALHVLRDLERDGVFVLPAVRPAAPDSGDLRKSGRPDPDGAAGRDSFDIRLVRFGVAFQLRVHGCSDRGATADGPRGRSPASEREDGRGPTPPDARRVDRPHASVPHRRRVGGRAYGRRHIHAAHPDHRFPGHRIRRRLEESAHRDRASPGQGIGAGGVRDSGDASRESRLSLRRPGGSVAPAESGAGGPPPSGPHEQDRLRGQWGRRRSAGESGVVRRPRHGMERDGDHEAGDVPRENRRGGRREVRRDRMRAAWFSIILLAALPGAGILLAKPASASADVALNTYLTPDGSRYFIEDGGSMPVGSTLRISVFTDLYSCDPVTGYWGDGAVETRTYGGNLVQSWEHAYNATGMYTIRATEPCGDGGATRTVIVGNGGLAIFDPSSALFFPTLFGLFLGLGALGMALGKPRVNPKVSPSASLDPNALRGPPSPVPPLPFR